jgi:hypothetical protein
MSIRNDLIEEVSGTGRASVSCGAPWMEVRADRDLFTLSMIWMPSGTE